MNENNRLNIKSWAAQDRPRDKFSAKGKNSLTDAELIAILIGSGNREESAVELAKRILKSVNYNLNELGRVSLEDLMRFKGVGEAKAITIAASLELGRRRKESDLTRKVAITSSSAAYDIISDVLTDLKQEEFWIILLDRANQYIDKVNISKGGVSGTIADARLVFKPAVEKLATSIILCHNHPSGNLKASNADISLTKKLVEAGRILDITILDHLIIGHGNYLSLADQQLM